MQTSKAFGKDWAAFYAWLWMSDYTAARDFAKSKGLVLNQYQLNDMDDSLDRHLSEEQLKMFAPFQSYDVVVQALKAVQANMSGSLYHNGAEYYCAK